MSVAEIVDHRLLAGYHARDLTDWRWAETRLLTFSVPQVRLMGTAYVMARPNLGVALSTVVISKGVRDAPWELDFHDPRAHLPCPEDFSHFTLPSGLSVDATRAPAEITFNYRAPDADVGFDLVSTALVGPYSATPQAADGANGLGDQWATGHYDLLAHVTGTLRLHGRTYAVDSFDAADSSWGPRGEGGDRALAWIPVVFDGSLGLVLVITLKLSNGELVMDRFRFGHAVVDGGIVPLVEAHVETQRHGMKSWANHVTARDSRGAEYEFHGTALASYPYNSSSPSSMAFQTLFEYRSGSSMGYGTACDLFGLRFLANRAAGGLV